MKITPLDIQQAGFKVRLRGYDRQEVDAFLDAVTEDYEASIRENGVLREKLTGYESQVAELKKKEATLTSTLMKAQELVEGMKHNAQKEAEMVVKEAELKAEALNRSAYEELSAVRREILDLQKQKTLFLERACSLVRIFQRVLESEEREDRTDERKNQLDEEHDDNVRLLKPQT